MRYLLTLTLLAITLVSCTKNDTTETINIGGRYSLDLPKSFKKANDLNPDATLQYMDAARELFVVVIDEPKEAVAKAIMENGLEDTYTTDLKGYSKLLLDSMEPNLKAAIVNPFTDTEIGGLKARKTHLEGIVEGVRIHYKLGMIESKKRFYQITVWTTLDRVEKQGCRNGGHHKLF